MARLLVAMFGVAALLSTDESIADDVNAYTDGWFTWNGAITPCQNWQLSSILDAIQEAFDVVHAYRFPGLKPIDLILE